MQVHRRNVAVWQHQAGGLAEPRTDRPEDVGRGRALILRCRRSRAASGPTPGDLVLLADPGFVGEPDFYRGRLDAFLSGNFVQQGREFF